MTNRDRLVVVALIISVFGFTLFTSINPSELSYISKASIVADDIKKDKVGKRIQASERSSTSKMISMLSEVLEIPISDVQLALDGGSTPRELLSNSGVLLSDLKDIYGFELVGERGLVRFV